MTGGGTPLERFLLHPNDAVAGFMRAVGHGVAAMGGRTGASVIASLFALLAARNAVRRLQARRLERGSRFVTILVPPEADPAGAETLWAYLVALLRPAWRRLLEGQPHVSFEYLWSAGGATIGMWVPGRVPPGMVERAVESAWPGCRAVVGDVPDSIPPQAAVTGGTLRLVTAEWFPLRTDFDADPLRSLFGAARDLDRDETVAVQVVARPVTGRRTRRGLRAAAAIRQGRPPTRIAQLIDLFLPGPRGRTPVRRADPSDTPDVRAILQKASGPSWEAVVRYAVARPAGPGGRGQLRGRAHAVASAFAVYAGRNNLRRRRLRRPARAIARRRFRRGGLLSIGELAALAHLPLDVAVPGVERAGARVVAAPPGVPTRGKLLGDAEVGDRRSVALAVADAAYHVHLMGATGSGKSTLITGLVLEDAAAGRGAVVVDPAGDLVNDILERLPAAAAHRTVLLDAESRDNPPAMNVLEGTNRDLVVDNVVGIFRSIFERYWGPRTDDAMRSACLTILRQRGATLADLPTLFTDEKVRARYTADIRDPVGLGGFWSWYESLPQGVQAQVIGPLMNKLRAFLLRDFARKVVGAARSSFNMSDVLDGGLCLVRLPKGVLGDEACRLLGSFVVAKVWQAATERARRPKSQRLPASLYVDECHNFLNLPRSFDEMLAEARKYGLSLVLAHQHLAQLPVRLGEAISANARSKVFFTTSPEDANALKRHVEPQLSAHDLAHLGAYQAAVRLLVNGEERPACTIRSRDLPPPIPGRASSVRALSRARYAGQAKIISTVRHTRHEMAAPFRADRRGDASAG